MIELGFVEGQVHPHDDGKYPNFSVDSLIIEGVLSRYFDPLQILAKWLKKVAPGGVVQIIDTDLECVLQQGLSGLDIEAVHQAIYGQVQIPKHSCLKYEQVIEIGKQLGLVAKTYLVQGLKFQVELVRESS